MTQVHLPAIEFHRKRLVGSVFILVRLIEISILNRGNMLHMSMLKRPRTQLTTQLTHRVWSKFLFWLSISKTRIKDSIRGRIIGEAQGE